MEIKYSQEDVVRKQVDSCHLAYITSRQLDIVRFYTKKDIRRSWWLGNGEEAEAVLEDSREI
jgi:hypothetical protein